MRCLEICNCKKQKAIENENKKNISYALHKDEMPKDSKQKTKSKQNKDKKKTHKKHFLCNAHHTMLDIELSLARSAPPCALQ